MHETWLTLAFLTIAGDVHWAPVLLTGRLDRTVTGHLHNGKSVEVAFSKEMSLPGRTWVHPRDLLVTRYDSGASPVINIGGKQVSCGPYRPATEAEILEFAKQAPYYTP